MSQPLAIYRLLAKHSGKILFALREEDHYVELGSSLEEAHVAMRAGKPLVRGAVLGDDLRYELLAPVAPSKIICVGLNYRKHAEEMGKEVPPEPLLFMKPPTALNHHGGVIELPPASSQVHHEGELAIVMGSRLSRASEREAADAILGYTCANDVTARDIQRRELRYTRAKGYDTFCPLGPRLVLARGFDVASKRLELRVNGELRQASQLDDFIFSIPHVVSFISHVMTLKVGDVILTGTPHGVDELVDGDEVSVTIEGIGELRNSVNRSTA